MSNSTPTWIHQPLRVLDFMYNPEMADYPMQDVIRMCRRMHANVLHFHCQYNMRGGFDEHGMFFRSRLAGQRNRDVLGEFLPLARKARIRTVVYLNLHWYTKAFAGEHPDWRVLLHDGTCLEKLYGDDDSSFCINSPWRDWSFTLIEDLCSYPIDGVFYDGPITFLRRRGCYCEHCRRLFREQNEREMPAPDAGNREDYSLLREFAVSSMVRYYRDATSIVKRTRPEAVAYANYANAAESDWAAGRANRRLVREMDLLLAEGGFMYGRVARNVFKTGASSRVYETQSGGKPAINAVSMAFSPWRWVSLSAPETRVLLSEASVGVNPYYAIFIQGQDMPGVRAASEVYGFLAKNAKYYRKTVSGATVALLQSSQTLNCYAGVDVPWADLGYQKKARSEAVGNYTRAFYGFYEMLLRSRVPFDIIDEARIEEGALNPYDAIILPNTACLSDAQCRALTSFVHEGGHLIADFESSHYDEHGSRRRELELSDVFGVQSRNAVSEYRRWDYVFVLDSRVPHMACIDTDFFPAPRHNLRVVSTSGTIQAVFSEPLVSNIVPSAKPSKDPFLVENRFGKGICHYFPASFGEFFEATRPQMYPRILAELLDPASQPLRVTGPPNLLDVHLRLQPRAKRTMIHLVNLELEPIDAVVPARGIRIVTHVPYPVKRVIALRAGREIRFQQTGLRARFTLPEMSEFEVVALEG